MIGYPLCAERRGAITARGVGVWLKRRLVFKPISGILRSSRLGEAGFISMKNPAGKGGFARHPS
jgi:hypothetical protein